VEKSATFGPFSGHKGAEADTTKRRGDTKDRCSGRGGETKNGRDRHRHEDANGDRDLIDGWENALLCDAIERTPGKKKPIREAYADRRVRERCQSRNQKSDDSSRRSGHS
jgi:hypothetical protein